MSEMVKNWLIELYEREIKEAIGSISNERIWLMGTDVWEEEKCISTIWQTSMSILPH